MDSFLLVLIRYFAIVTQIWNWCVILWIKTWSNALNLWKAWITFIRLILFQKWLYVFFLKLMEMPNLAYRVAFLNKITPAEWSMVVYVWLRANYLVKELVLRSCLQVELPSLQNCPFLEYKSILRYEKVRLRRLRPS